MHLTLKDSPLSICLISLLFISMGYLVYIHPEQFQLFQLFVHTVLIGGFLVLAGLIIASYKPFASFYREYVNQNGKLTGVKPHLDYHNQLQENTKRELDQLMKS
jgi:hypothetical protein